jgi:hypothetical protein
VKPGIPVPFCAGCPPVADGVTLMTAELIGIELGVMVLGAEKASVVVVSSGE